MLTVESFWRDFSTLQLPSEHIANIASVNYLLAYSGGCDSHVLLHLLTELKRLNYICNLKAVHINHQLQEHSDQWAEHCVQQCEQYNIACEVITVNVDTSLGIGSEAAARKARYDVLGKMTTEQTCLLTAQHADDQVETFLLQSLRGGGVKGLASMPILKSFSQGYLYRPLLHVTQSRIIEYATFNNLNWLDDPSNDNTDFDRNFLRQKVIPVLKQRWPSLDKTFYRITRHQAEASGLIDDLAAIDLLAVQSDNHLISIAALNKLSLSRKKNVLRYWISEQNKLTMPDAAHLMRILNEVVTAADDSQPSVSWNDTVVRRFQGNLYVQNNKYLTAPTPIKNWTPEKEYPVYISDKLRLKTCSTIGKGLSVAKLAAKNVSIRYRQGGERCCPQGRGPHQHKLKTLLQEWQVAPWLRDRIPLVYVDDVLAQVVGYCVCEPFAADPGEVAYDIVLLKAPV